MEAVAVLMISEIMFNPASSERAPVETEWVELYNPTDQPVNLTGWYLQDEDGKTGPVPEGTILEPGKALVLIPAAQDVDAFRKAWDPAHNANGDSDDANDDTESASYQVVPLKHWGTGGLHNLSNDPGEDNEILTLRRPDESISDKVNYDDDGETWPADDPDGSSIYVMPGALNPLANDHGKAWRKSEPGKLGARHATTPSEYDTNDVGSPGTVMTKEDVEARGSATQPDANEDDDQ